MRSQPFVLSLCLVVASLSGAQAASYRFESIILPGEEPSTGYFYGFGFTSIDGLGQIAGTYFKPESDGEIGYFTGFLRSPDGSFRSLRPFTTDINNTGASVGYTSKSDIEAGFLVDAGGVVEIFQLEVPSSPGIIRATTARGINDHGQVVGSVDSFSSTWGFLRDIDGAISIFQGPESASLVPTSINNHGQIAGYVHTSNGLEGFVRDVNGSFELFSFDGYNEYGQRRAVYPQGINDAGQVVGYFLDTISGFTYRGFVRDDTGEVTFLDFPGGDYRTMPMGIDDSGRIVGNYLSPPDYAYATAFIATPVPIPGAFGLLLSGLVACSTMRRRRLDWDCRKPLFARLERPQSGAAPRI